MIDTHCHLNLPPLSEDARTVWKQANEAGVHTAIIVGANLESSRAAIETVRNLDGTHAAVGIHPDCISTSEETDGTPLANWTQELESLSTEKEVVAIGECGLDYVELHSLSSVQVEKVKNQQKRLFGIHIQLAKKHHLPLIIHTRNTRNSKDEPQHALDAYADVIDVLEHYSKTDGIIPSFVLHCMSGTTTYLEKGLALGGYISFAGNISYPSAGPLRELLHATPLDRLLLETDAPFLAPQSKRGSTNTPANITETYEFVANELGLSIEALTQQVVTNAGNLFQFKI